MGKISYDLIEFLDKYVLPEICRPRGFELFDPVAERHGSWEWFYKKSDELDRFVSVALMSLPSTAPATNAYEVEIWAGAEKSDRYTRRLISNFHASGLEEYRDAIRSALEEPLVRAMSVAESFTGTDLTEVYPPTRLR